jgi:hypothetical protein
MLLWMRKVARVGNGELARPRGRSVPVDIDHVDIINSKIDSLPVAFRCSRASVGMHRL